MKKTRWMIGLLMASGAVLALTSYAIHKEASHTQPTLTTPVAKEPRADGQMQGPQIPMVPQPHANAMPKAVLGYYTVSTKNKASLESLQSFGGGYLNKMTTMTFTALSDGTIGGQPPTDGLQAAKQKNVLAYAALTNGADGFSPDVAHAIVSDANTRARLVQNAVTLVKSYGYGGINVDFENMLPGDRTNFTASMTELAQALHQQGATLIISVMAKTTDSPTRDWVGTFDYAALGQIADQIQLMTYDEHGTWGEPGAVAGLPWVQHVIDYATSQIPAAKLLLGLPAYGYDWNASNAKQSKAVALKNIPALLQKTGATVEWDAKTQSPHFTYSGEDGAVHQVWYENPDSIAIKAKLVTDYQLGGIAVWRMGFEDDAFWQAVEKGLRE